jgi:hypothetical protein
MYPRIGNDLFDYVGYERLWSVYGANPLILPANSHPDDWSYAFVVFRDRPPAYGPLWVLITWPLVWLAGDNPAAYVAGYKLLVLASYAACCGLIWCNVEPQRRARALMVFGWSPLVLVDVLGYVHNDALPAVGVLVAVLLATRSTRAGGLVAAVAGALVKASALAIAPVIALGYIRQRRWGSLALGLLASGVLIWLAYAPFWAGADTIRAVLQQTGRVIWSPGALLLAASTWLTGGAANGAVRPLLLVMCAAGCLLVLRRARLNTARGTAAASGYVFLLGVLLLTTAFYAHYLVPVVALAALSGDRRLEHLVSALAIGGMAAYGCDMLYAALGREWFDSTAYQVIGSLITLGPALATAATWLKPEHRQRAVRVVAG